MSINQNRSTSNENLNIRIVINGSKSASLNNSAIRDTFLT